MDVKFLDDRAHTEAKTVLALVCPDPNSPDQAQVITGPNARSFLHEPSTRDKIESHNQTQPWQVCTQTPVQVQPKRPSCSTDHSVGHLK